RNTSQFSLQLYAVPRDLPSFPTRALPICDTERATAEHLASQLKEGDSSSLYAHNAAFFLAKIAVSQGDLDKAARDTAIFARKKADRKSTGLNSSHVKISYAVFRLKKTNIT